MTGVDRTQLACLTVALAPRWEAHRQGRLHSRRGGRARLRAEGAGRTPVLSFPDRVVVTLVVLRHGVTHDVMAAFLGVSRQTITAAVSQVRPLLAAHGVTVAAGDGRARLVTLEDLFAYLEATGTTARLDATEVQVRRPRAHKSGRKQFISGKARRNTVKAAVATDDRGRLLWVGAVRPGRMHDATQVRTEGVGHLLECHPGARLLVDAGYQGLAKAHPTQVTAPPVRPRAGADPGELEAWRAAKHAQSSDRIAVERGIGHLKNWRSLARWHGHRGQLGEVILAVAAVRSYAAHTPGEEAVGP
jgi:hypothetical protein